MVADFGFEEEGTTDAPLFPGFAVLVCASSLVYHHLVPGDLIFFECGVVHGYFIRAGQGFYWRHLVGGRVNLVGIGLIIHTLERGFVIYCADYCDYLGQGLEQILLGRDIVAGFDPQGHEALTQA